MKPDEKSPLPSGNDAVLPRSPIARSVRPDSADELSDDDLENVAGGVSVTPPRLKPMSEWE